ncbi:urea ABC transporter permease subunit UrtB [Roseibacillus ishigakijimensis]|uniref:Urea ABC transporter permease subunit UrtB n=1 Tax=Roseibacillus ishigakijimensis TaxID=454146 RepID=A0A934RLN8_9BACT|nr:urea ABC transporter permease subunit UrtB [Roseibacillus ishigakijimensis]MBK1833065.1 urea ABC transporter permease subunit UrtB [Roseibacillus ishigakijimensis]
MRTLLYLLPFFLCLSSLSAQDELSTRKILSQVILLEDDAQEQAIAELRERGEPIIGEVVEAWRLGKVSIDETPAGPRVLLETSEDSYVDLLTGKAATASEEVKISRASRSLRKTLKRIVDVLDLRSPDLNKRIAAAEKLGLSQNEEYLPDLRELTPKQEDKKVKKAFQEALWISELKNGTPDEQLAAVSKLGEMKSYPARDFLEKLLSEKQETAPDNLADFEAAITTALRKIDDHQKIVEIAGTLVRGLSTGSVLLLVAYGLAITFGQMGVINMAHGEFIAIGGYTTYLVQNFFLTQYGPDSAAFQWYFIIALPIAFLASALVGAGLEKGLIQFLYKRPLESLLATWGVSMILQQVFRLKFGAANVAVASPGWLSGSYELWGISLSYNRISLIIFAALVVVVTWLLLTKTNWGLHVRATMQNRQMSSCLGVSSARVNMLTFAFGSGLAGLAGAFLSQIGNVGPSMGQTYIVDSFMVVVVGGVGNLFGAAISSLGIGVVDQGLQPLFGPVMGKITVLLGIILFLQFKPGGIFPARSRSLED